MGSKSNHSMGVVLSLKYEENDFIQACVRRENWAQKKLYEDYYSKMMAICLRYSNNKEDALDILHEGFIKIFKNIDKYKVGTSLSAWIRRVMVNTAIDYYRTLVRRRTENIDTAYDLSTDVPDAVSKCTEKEILAAVQQLSPVYRMVFNLYVIEGFPHREIGEKLNITESTSRANLVKARAKLKRILASNFVSYGR